MTKTTYQSYPQDVVILREALHLGRMLCIMMFDSCKPVLVESSPFDHSFGQGKLSLIYPIVSLAMEGGSQSGSRPRQYLEVLSTDFRTRKSSRFVVRT